MPRQSFFHRAPALAPADRVWSGLQNPATWREIGGVNMVDAPTFDVNGELTGYRFAVTVGGTEHVGQAVRTWAEQVRRMVMSIDSEHLNGEIAVDLAPDGNQTLVGVSMTMASKGLLSTMTFPMIAAAVASGFGQAVERFVASLATPEI